MTNLRRIRKDRGYTLHQLAEVSGMAYSQIQLIDSGSRDIGNITAKNLITLSRMLNVQPEELMETAKGTLD